MQSLPQLMLQRQIGLSQAQDKLNDAMTKKAADALIQDLFSHHDLSFSSKSFLKHSFFRYLDYIAILSKQNPIEEVAELALVYLPKLQIRWKTVIPSVPEDDSSPTCMLSTTGAVVVTSPLLWIKEGIFTCLPPIQGKYIPIGERLFSMWKEKNIPKNSKMYFGECNQKGNLLHKYPIDHQSYRKDHLEVYHEHYWVRLSSSHRIYIPSLIEVVTFSEAKIQTFEWPDREDPLKFSSAALIHNRLYLGISKKHPTFCVYDITLGTILAQISTQQILRSLTTDTHYAAWCVHRGDNHFTVQYMRLGNPLIHTATSFNWEFRHEHAINLHITGSCLSVIYPKVENYTIYWIRKAIEMATGKTLYAVTYQKGIWGACSLFNNQLVLTDDYDPTGSFYVENFTASTPFQKMTDVREGKQLFKSND